MFIETAFTRLLGIRTPLVAAPMAGASGGKLAARVTLGGGFGFISAGYDSVQALCKELDLARLELASEENKPVELGVGYLVWQLDLNQDKGREFITAALAAKVKAIWLAFGQGTGSWIRFIREFDEKRDHKTLVFVQVCSAKESEAAIKDWNVDVLVIQGNESGGHGASNSPPILTLLSSVLSKSPNGPPILAAGGLATGSQIAGMLTIGASGVVMGTRFLLTPESLYNEAQRRSLVAASDSTVRTMAFDYARGTLGWPEGIDGRALYNDTVKDFNEGMDLTEIRSKFNTGVAQGDPKRMLVWAGTGVSLMTSIEAADELVLRLHEECISSLRSASTFIRP